MWLFKKPWLLHCLFLQSSDNIPLLYIDKHAWLAFLTSTICKYVCTWIVSVTCTWFEEKYIGMLYQKCVSFKFFLNTFFRFGDQTTLDSQANFNLPFSSSIATCHWCNIPLFQYHEWLLPFKFIKLAFHNLLILRACITGAYSLDLLCKVACILVCCSVALFSTFLQNCRQRSVDAALG